MKTSQKNWWKLFDVSRAPRFNHLSVFSFAAVRYLFSPLTAYTCNAGRMFGYDQNINKQKKNASWRFVSVNFAYEKNKPKMLAMIFVLIIIFRRKRCRARANDLSVVIWVIEFYSRMHNSIARESYHEQLLISNGRSHCYQSSTFSAYFVFL